VLLVGVAISQGRLRLERERPGRGRRPGRALV
jgi:hypothetical protein